ncbi:hypothetical protein ABVT39_004430 [Epinephelus coioides]
MWCILGTSCQSKPVQTNLPRRRARQHGRLNFKDNSIESRREAVIRGLILYLGEKTEELMKDYKVFDDDSAATLQEALTTHVLNIFVAPAEVRQAAMPSKYIDLYHEK